MLDPACGTGNFLYVTLELMKRLEGEVLDALAGYARGDAGLLDLAGATVDPHQFLGLDVNPRAVPVAELVLWIGYLQWHFRTNGKAPPAPPILRDFRTIREGDALLSYTRIAADKDSAGKPVTRWGGCTVPDPITGEDVPDLTDQVLVLRPMGGKQAPWRLLTSSWATRPSWPARTCGRSWVAATRKPCGRLTPRCRHRLTWRCSSGGGRRSCAGGGRAGKVRRFGFITSNSIRGVFCRRVLAAAMEGTKPLHLAFAIPDHPWAQGDGAAAVRIAMTVGAPGTGAGRLLTVEREGAGAVPDVALAMREGTVNADLTVGASPQDAKELKASINLAHRGVNVFGKGFITTLGTAKALGLGQVSGLDRHIRPYVNGRDVSQRSRDAWIIDFFGLKNISETELSRRLPTLVVACKARAGYQRTLVHPEDLVAIWLATPRAKAGSIWPDQVCCDCGDG